MSNLSTLPKGDSAWLLRKAIERIIQQVSVLETNIGASTSGNSANTQIIFNDNGTLRGDAGLVYNKTTDTLTAGSATIIGAATVGTTLGVTGDLSAAANSILGTGSKSTDTLLDFKADTGTQRIYLDRGGRNLIFKDVTTNIENYRITGVTGVHTWGVGGSTAMTLNSTGLGIGIVASNSKLSVYGTGDQTDETATFSVGNTVVGGMRLYVGVNNTNEYVYIGSVKSGSNYSSLILQPNGGNVGIGVTPSAWASAVKGLQLSTYGAIGASSGNMNVFGNLYSSAGGTAYLANGFGNLLQLTGGQFVFYLAGNNTLGADTIASLNPAMTLTTSGNLSLANGNVVMATSGKGIDFSATASGSGTMTSELLNDYEEGTWTGTMTGGTTNPTTPVTQVGRYTKIGRVVTVQIEFLGVDTTGASGIINITGLPFTNNASASSVGGLSSYNLCTFTGSPFVYLNAGDSYLILYSNVSGAAFSNVNHNAGASRYCIVSITYTVA